ncbi:DUF4272 domain-containing protein [Mycolicibacterium porcinum]
MKSLLARLKGVPPKPDHVEGEPDSDGVLVNAYCTRSDVPVPGFPHALNGHRDLSDPELAQHLAGLVGYVLSRGDGQMTRNRYHVLRHVQRVQQHWSLTIDEAQLDALAQWAQRANAIVFLPDGGIRDPQGRLLLSADGAEADPGTALPYPDQAWQRKARTEAELAARSLSPSASLPPLISEPELRQRTPQEIAERAFALLAVAVRAESMATGEALPLDSLLQRLPSAEAALTPKERAFLFDQAPTQSEVAQFAWRYECLAVLQWAMGLLDVLPFPDAICDVPRATRTMLDATDVQGVLGAMRMRSGSEILDALDLHYRLHWLVRQAQLKELPAPEGLDRGVVVERHYALNWLVRFEDSAWDEVDTPT